MSHPTVRRIAVAAVATGLALGLTYAAQESVSDPAPTQLAGICCYAL